MSQKVHRQRMSKRSLAGGPPRRHARTVPYFAQGAGGLLSLVALLCKYLEIFLMGPCGPNRFTNTCNKEFAS